MENFGWFGSIESCIVLPCTSKFSTDFAVLLSFTSVLSWFQGMGRKSYLLGLLGLLLISCKCTLAFFLRKEKLSFASISVRTVSSNNFYAHEKFYFVSMYMKANSLTSDLQGRFRPFCFKSKLQSIRSVGNCKIRYVYIVKSRSIAFRFHHSLVSIGNCPLATYLLATI